MPERTTVIAGRCTTTYEGPESTREQRGDAVVVCKPDDTVLVHDADGYQPAAWLTRADGVALEDDCVTAWDGEARLAVTVHDRYGGGQFPTTRAGEPVDHCPSCDGPLVRTGGAVACLDCDARYGIPPDATVLHDNCGDCGLPRIRVARGQVFAVCLDPRCDSLDERVADAYDRAWACPDCGDDLRVLRRHGLILGCASYPACEVSITFPTGEIVADCACGLPVFETDGDRRCLDPDCEQRETDPGHDGEPPAANANAPASTDTETPQGL